MLNVLSLDCGGLFEIVSGQVLAELERLLRRQTGDPNFRLADVFHIVSGTGVGGILAALYLCPNRLGRPRFSAEEVTDFLFDHGDFMFAKAQLPHRHPGSARYHAANLEATLEAYLGDVYLSQLMRPCHLSAFDLITDMPYVFRSHAAKGDAEADFPMTTVLRAIAAMPDWFEKARFTHGDRHFIFCENGRYPGPSEAALAECLTWFGKRPPQINLLSLKLAGTAKSCATSHHHPRPRRMQQLTRQLFPPHEKAGRFLQIAPTIPKHIDPCPDLATEQQLKWLGRLGLETAREFEEDLDQFATILREAA